MSYSAKSEQGAVLAIALILLLVITLVGLSTYQTTGLEETMAANAQQKNMTFQASEAAIEEALDDIVFLGSAYTADLQGTTNPTKSSTSSGADYTVVATAEFLERRKDVVDEGSAVSISTDSNAFAFYNYSITSKAELNNTYSSNTNVQGAYIKAVAAN